MFICSAFFFFSFFFSFASSSYFNTTTHQCSALLLFKQNLSSINFPYAAGYYCEDWLGSEGYYPIMVNWNDTTDCCDWDGVTCDHSTGDVIGLDLSCDMLQGALHPNTSLFNLPRLQTLNLAFNDFTGSQLPREIGRFSTTLTQLNISYSGFSGEVPTDITLLRNLVSLDLSINGFSGQIPTDITLLHNLVSLDLSENEFSGQVPAGITLLRNLVSLDLSFNAYGDISLEPRVFINLLQNHTCLEQLSLAYVNIFSVLPTHLNISSSSLKLLNLYYTGLHGKLPHYLFNLQSLEKLSLLNNGFTGQIPWETSLLPNLVSLDLSGNDNLRMKPHIFNSLLHNSTLLRYLWLSDVNIGLVLPTYLNISSLKSLDLKSTSLKGKLPDNIFNLQYLEQLDLSENINLIGPLPRVNATVPLKRLSLSSTNLLLGEIPDSISHFKSLKSLNLFNCSLTGPLPKSIGNLRHLTSLDLSSNKLNGTLPSSLFSLRSLEILSLGDNQFDGQIDVLTFQQLTNLTWLDLSHNNFSGDWELETLLSSLTNLIGYLDLSYSGLSVITSNANHHVNPNFNFLYLASCKIKVFPESLRSMRNLEYLDLSNNQIHGQIPHWVGEIGGTTLYRLNLSDNFITGLPEFQWYRLQDLYLQSNLIQGPFPPSICNMSNLEYLDLSNNSFDGGIPKCFGNITSSLVMINLRTNRFQGTIPNVYDNCRWLEGLILNGNQFKGEMPSSLSKCQSLKVLDMGNNHLSGTFPHWLESLPNLQVLVLKSNNFHGHIVPSSTRRLIFPTLQVIDLSHNGFEGQLPRKYFQNFNAMKNSVKKSTTPEYLSVGGQFYSFVVSVKGVEEHFTQLYVYYTIVCLSHNNFVREIPDIIGNLDSLVELNLSHNSLVGQIPLTFGKLSEIESLDLSCNQLTGKIPQSLADLTFLEFLNLSQNHLVGLIPVGKQLNTFQENSFEGNPNLCGFQLHLKCTDKPQDPQFEGDGDDDEEDSWFTWRVVMLGYGCGTLFGLVMGYLMLSTRRPMWFNAIADAMEQMILKGRSKRRYIFIGR